jgi:hypothetical protein
LVGHFLLCSANDKNKEKPFFPQNVGKLRHIKIKSLGRKQTEEKTIGERSKLHARTHTPLNKTTGEEEDGKKERKFNSTKNTSGPQS